MEQHAQPRYCKFVVFVPPPRALICGQVLRICLPSTPLALRREGRRLMKVDDYTRGVRVGGGYDIFRLSQHNSRCGKSW